MKIMRWRALGVLLSTTMLLGNVAYAHAQGQAGAIPARLAPGRRATPPTASASTWRLVCYQCHGTVGQGSRPTGPHIAPNPLPYEVFAGVVGRPVKVTPPYTTVVLSDQDLGDIYAYLLTIPPLVDSKAAAILDH
jgi:mono/diheme cytochrome c family protein